VRWIDPRVTTRCRERGATLAELVIAVSLLGIGSTIMLPRLGTLHRAAELRAVTGQISGLMARCRAHAVMHHTATGLVFERDDEGWRCFLAEDRDGDGIRHDDLEAGRDRIVSEVLQLEADRAGLGILRDVRVPDPTGHGRLGGNLDDPVRAGSGDIVTFGPTGTATSSSVYFTDGAARMRVIRVYGITGRIRTLVWHTGWSGWRAVGL
jgi:type II secretory pathway pseudopilin PulG